MSNTRSKKEEKRKVTFRIGENEKCAIFKCYSSEKLIALNTLHEVVPTWY